MYSLSIGASHPFAQKFLLVTALLLSTLLATTSFTFADWSASNEPAELSTLAIRVFDASDRNPIAEAKILVLNETGHYKVATITTDRAGHGAIQLAQGTYQIRVEARGYRTYHRVNVQVGTAQENDLAVALDALTRGGSSR